MKKIYKLTIIYDTEDDDCESLYETVDIIDDDDSPLNEDDYADKDIRESLIELGIMGDA
tara:strand:- start:9339 stop:9515 length:177 start_codon:yes stop_codon:yes gene_type:complete